MKTKVLNLYSGLGGNRQLWENVEVTAIELEDKIIDVYKDQFPNDTVIKTDAADFLLHNHQEFDFVWASPPCQSHSKMMKATRHDVRKYPDMTLYQQIIFLEHFFKGKWVVENVNPYYKPLIKPTTVMGRHLFWSNFEIMPVEVPTIKGFITAGNTKETDKMKEWLGINYEGNIYYKNNHCPGQVLRNCVHPQIGLHVFNESKRIGLFKNIA